jgi:hypothetical protein
MKSLIKKKKVTKKVSTQKAVAQCCAKVSKATAGCHD